MDIEKLFVRNSGTRLLVDIHVHADAEISLEEAHAIGGHVKAKLMTDFPRIVNVLVHMEPAPAEIAA